MNYTKKGIHEKQKSLHATSTRLLKKGLLAVLNLFLIAVLACGIIGASLGIGIFKGVIDTAPSIENVKVTPTGFSTFVYDLEGNQIAKLISQNSNRIPVTWDMIPENLAHAFVAISMHLLLSRMNVFMSITESISRVSSVLPTLVYPTASTLRKVQVPLPSSYLKITSLLTGQKKKGSQTV